jgi:hypothetical protein
MAPRTPFYIASRDGVYMPKGDPSQAKFYCQSTDGQANKDSPCKLNGPFHLTIDQQDRIWITNTAGAGLDLETKARLVYLKLTGATLSAIDLVVVGDLVSHPGMGSVSHGGRVC